MTREVMWGHIQRIARQTVPGLAVDIRSGLYDISVAEQLVENRTGRVVHKATIALDATSTTGEYALPADLRAIEKITWAPVGGKGYWPVEVYAPDAFDRVREADILAGPSAPSSAPLVPSSGAIFAMRDITQPETLVVYPTGIAGTLTVRYKPELTPYSPDDPLWATYGDNPEAAMATHGLDESMTGMADGIIRYAAAMLLRGAPGGLQLYGSDIALLMREWTNALDDFARRTVTPGLETTPPVLRPFGGVH